MSSDRIRETSSPLVSVYSIPYRESDPADAWRRCGYLALLALPGDVFAVNASRPVDVQPPSEDRLCILLAAWWSSS